MNNNNRKSSVLSSSRCTEIIIILLLIISTKSFPQTSPSKNNVIDNHGAIISGDTTSKVLSLVFTGHEFADGGDVIQHVLKQNNIQAGFFFTGSFYSNKNFTSLIKSLKQDGHYLGAHSDQHLLYADWIKRDSLLVTKNEFTADLNQNYQRMRQYGIEKVDAHFFLPPFEWYNSKIADWTNELNLTLINFTPGTRSTADYTYPEMGDRYVSSNKIYKSILDYEEKDTNGLNGFILLIHIGTDPRRSDKFYNRLDELVRELKSRGYSFVRVDVLLR